MKVSVQEISQKEPLAVPIKSVDLFVFTFDLKTDDYILIKFETTNKRKLTYKYVATVINISDENDVEIQCFEAVDKENTEFVLIDNDVSMIDLGNIIG